MVKPFEGAPSALAEGYWNSQWTQEGLHRYHPDMDADIEEQKQAAEQVHFLQKDANSWCNATSSKVTSEASREGSMTWRKDGRAKFDLETIRPAAAIELESESKGGEQGETAHNAGGEKGGEKKFPSSELKARLLAEQQKDREKQTSKFGYWEHLFLMSYRTNCRVSIVCVGSFATSP